MNMKKSVIFILMISFSALIQANRLFLENNYGAEIICKVNRVINNPAMPNREEPTTIANGVRVLLGLIPFNPEVRNAWVNNLEIKTSRYLPLSSYTSLQNYIEQLSDALLKCCTLKMNPPICKQNICNKDAVIIVNPSYIGSAWNIDIRWEAAATGGRKVISWE